MLPPTSCLETAPWLHVHDPCERPKDLAALLVVHAGQPTRPVRVGLKIHALCRLALPDWFAASPAPGIARIIRKHPIQRH